MKIKTDFNGSTLELSHPVAEMNWEEAMTTEWTDGWRLPTRAELITLYHEAEDAGHSFRDTSIVWTASSYALVPTYAWPVYFHNGSSYANGKTNTGVVRLVREVQQ